MTVANTINTYEKLIISCSRLNHGMMKSLLSHSGAICRQLWENRARIHDGENVMREDKTWTRIFILVTNLVLKSLPEYVYLLDIPTRLKLILWIFSYAALDHKNPKLLLLYYSWLRTSRDVALETQHTILLVSAMPKDVASLIQAVDGSTHLFEKRIHSYICSPPYLEKVINARLVSLMTLAGLLTGPGQSLSPPAFDLSDHTPAEDMVFDRCTCRIDESLVQGARAQVHYGSMDFVPGVYVNAIKAIE